MGLACTVVATSDKRDNRGSPLVGRHPTLAINCSSSIFDNLLLWSLSVAFKPLEFVEYYSSIDNEFPHSVEDLLS